MKNISSTAKEIRSKLGVTQKELAKLLGITTVQLSKIENGRSMPSAKTIQRYRDVSGIDPFVLDWCREPQLETLPEEVRDAAAALHRIWSDSLD